MFGITPLTGMDDTMGFLINLMFHVFILFTFLTIFFFKFISVMTEDHIDAELKSIVEDQTNNLMKSVDANDTKQLIRWDLVEAISGQLVASSSGEVKFITDNNKQLKANTFCVIWIMLTVIITSVVYFMFRGVNLHLKYLLLENFVIFTFIGMIEIYFFLNIASQYVPVVPSTAAITVLDRLKLLFRTT